MALFGLRTVPIVFVRLIDEVLRLVFVRLVDEVLRLVFVRLIDDYYV